MTAKDINDIIKTLCPNDDDFEKPTISPAYLKNELEALALEQEPYEDCISRKEVLDIINFEYNWLINTKRHSVDIDIAFNSLKSKVKALTLSNSNHYQHHVEKVRDDYEL